MYVHPAFKPRPGAIEALLEARGFGTLVALDGETPIAVHVPFLFTRTPDGGVIELHIARANPIHEAIRARPRVLLTCLGADAYISPDWYASENQVPTWNYVAAHATGLARIMDRDEFLGHVDRLSARFEERLAKAPWTSAKMDPHRRAAMLNAIVGSPLRSRPWRGNGSSGNTRARPITPARWPASERWANPLPPPWRI
jgi:transcriptional regulator